VRTYSLRGLNVRNWCLIEEVLEGSDQDECSAKSTVILHFSGHNPYTKKPKTFKLYWIVAFDLCLRKQIYGNTSRNVKSKNNGNRRLRARSKHCKSRCYRDLLHCKSTSSQQQKCFLHGIKVLLQLLHALIQHMKNVMASKTSETFLKINKSESTSNAFFRNLVGVPSTSLHLHCKARR